MRQLRHLLSPLLATLCVTVLLMAAPAAAKEVKFELDPAKFGHLDQHDTDCPNVNCGPASAANSFLYLQQAFPTIYTGNTTLVPTLQGGGFDLAGVANSLGAAYMGGCAGASCGATPSGTLIEDFIIGKMGYFSDRAPGTTVVEAQMNFTWRDNATTTPDLKHPSPKPALVQDGTKPTLAWLAEQLRKGQDVELFMANGANQHYITLTGITFDDVTNKGSMKIIDPWTGTEKTVAIEGLTNGYIDTDYTLDGGGFDFVAHAVAESPVPEPQVLLLLVCGLVVLRIGLRPKA